MTDSNNHMPSSVRSGDAKRIHVIAVCGVAMAALAGMLKQRGFDCARRTVVKYREAMGLGSSVQRRRQRKIAGAA